MARRAWNAGGSDRPAHEPVDRIIRGRRMPRMTGIERLAQVRGNYPARGLGVNAFMVKPYAPEQSESKLTALARQLRAASILAAREKIGSMSGLLEARIGAIMRAVSTRVMSSARRSAHARYLDPGRNWHE